MSSDFSGKVALVTGGGTGIGRAVASRLVAAGASTALVGRRPGVLAETALALGSSAIAIPADVTRSDDRARIVQSTIEQFGGLDILVNNAGAVTAGPLEELTESDWRRVLDVNVTAPMFLAREALPHLRARGGAVLNVSTGASTKPVPGFTAYGASKVALNYASQVLALEAAPEVRVNVICPGGVDTAIFETFQAEDEIVRTKEWFAGATPLGRIAQPADIADAAVWLVSEEARFITGAVIPVDGGLNLG